MESLLGLRYAPIGQLAFGLPLPAFLVIEPPRMGPGPDPLDPSSCGRGLWGNLPLAPVAEIFHRVQFTGRLVLCRFRPLYPLLARLPFSFHLILDPMDFLVL